MSELGAFVCNGGQTIACKAGVVKLHPADTGFVLLPAGRTKTIEVYGNITQNSITDLAGTDFTLFKGGATQPVIFNVPPGGLGLFTPTGPPVAYTPLQLEAFAVINAPGGNPAETIRGTLLARVVGGGDDLFVCAVDQAVNGGQTGATARRCMYGSNFTSPGVGVVSRLAVPTPIAGNILRARGNVRGNSFPGASEARVVINGVVAITFAIPGFFTGVLAISLAVVAVLKGALVEFELDALGNVNPADVLRGSFAVDLA